MKRILHIIDSLATGGAERLVIDTINSLKDYDHHLIILNGPENLKAELSSSIPFRNLHQKNHWQVFTNSRRVRRYIQKNEIDLVHSHLYFSSVLARLATPKRIPLYNSLHIISSLDNYSNSKLSLFLEKATYRRQHRIIAVSKEVLNDFDKWIGIKGEATVLYNFIDDRYFQNAPKESLSEDHLKLVAVGNLRYQKNYPYLIEAFKQMPATVSLDVYGEGPLRDQLQKQINQYHLNIRLMGRQIELHKILPLYDVFVMSSFFEGQPLSLLEAIASGLPTLLSDIPVLKEVTEQNAVYFNLHDPMDFVKKTKAILDKELIITRHTKPALERISRFARKEIYMNKLRQLYNNAIANQKSVFANLLL